MDSMDTVPWKKQKTEKEDKLLKCSQLYVIMWLNPEWIDAKDILAVNGWGQISFNYGDWHGKADYERNPLLGGIWHMNFKTQGSRGEMTMHYYRQVRGSLIYLNQEEGENSKYNSTLLPSPDTHIKDWEVMREAWLDKQRIKQYIAHRDRVGDQF
jgi:hypothetical protein